MTWDEDAVTEFINQWLPFAKAVGLLFAVLKWLRPRVPKAALWLYSRIRKRGRIISAHGLALATSGAHATATVVRGSSPPPTIPSPSGGAPPIPWDQSGYTPSVPTFFAHVGDPLDIPSGGSYCRPAELQRIWDEARSRGSAAFEPFFARLAATSPSSGHSASFGFAVRP